VLAGVRCTDKELLHISLVFSYGLRNNSSKLRYRMSSRPQRNEMDQVDDTLHKISVPKKRQRRKYHNITGCCKTVYLCHRQNWLYIISWWKCVCSLQRVKSSILVPWVLVFTRGREGCFRALCVSFVACSYRPCDGLNPLAKGLTVYKLES